MQGMVCMEFSVTRAKGESGGMWELRLGAGVKWPRVFDARLRS